jgi:hypothetical protein
MVKLENVRTAMLRGFLDGEICTAEEISRRTLRRYKKSIRKRGLKTLPETTEEQRALFLKQIQRWEDVIRQANRTLMSSPVLTGKLSSAPLLKVITEATKSIVEYSQKMGILTSAPLVIEGKMEVKIPELEGLNEEAVTAIVENYLEDEAKRLREEQSTAVRGPEDSP